MPGQCNCVPEACHCAPRFDFIAPQPDEEIERVMQEEARKMLDALRQKPIVLPEGAKVTAMRSPMTWICRNGHRVVFWRDHCATCGAGAHGFDDTSGVGFPD